MRKVWEKIIEKLLFISASVTILTTIGIILVLAVEAFGFFKEVSFIDFVTDKEWTPLFTNKHFGISALLSGTLLITLIAVAVALPIGLSIAVYLNEYAPGKFRKSVKPTLEL